MTGAAVKTWPTEEEEATLDSSLPASGRKVAHRIFHLLLVPVPTAAGMSRDSRWWRALFKSCSHFPPAKKLMSVFNSRHVQVFSWMNHQPQKSVGVSEDQHMWGFTGAVTGAEQCQGGGIKLLLSYFTYNIKKDWGWLWCKLLLWETCDLQQLRLSASQGEV